MERERQIEQSGLDFKKEPVAENISNAPNLPETRVGQEEVRKRDEAREIKKLREGLAESGGEKREKMIEKIMQEAGIQMVVHLTGEQGRKVRGFTHDEYNSISENFIDNSGYNKRMANNLGLLSDKVVDKLGADNLSLCLTDHNINEIIDIRPVKKALFKTVTIPGKKGFLGIGRTPDKTESELAGFKPILHNEIVSNGKKETAIAISYIASNLHYYTTNVRPGRKLSASFVIPESIAKELEIMLDKDPSLMRDIVEQAMKQKFLEDESVWEEQPTGKNPNKAIPDNLEGKYTSMRPPYEEWDKTSGRIYIHREQDKPGWHEENVRTIKKSK